MLKSFLRRSKRIYNLRPLIKTLPYYVSGFRCSLPRMVDIELTNRCNLRCSKCWFHGESGVGDKFQGSELSTEEVFSLVDQFARHRPEFYLGGAEPLLRSDFIAIVEYIKSKDLSVRFTTNGTLLNTEDIEALVSCGTDGITFSVDGHEVLHDQIRGDGNFKAVISAIRNISEYKRTRGYTKPTITANLSVARVMAGDLKKTFRAVQESTDGGVDSYTIHHLWYITEEEMTTHKSEVGELLGVKAPGCSSHFIPSSQVLSPDLISKEISQLSDESKIGSFPLLSTRDLANFYSQGAEIRKRCIASFSGVVIKPNGDVRFCPDEWIDDYILGNIRKERFEHIWNGDKARQFRSILFKKGHFAGCKRCSWMYAF